jgi:hypothetical protein
VKRPHLGLSLGLRVIGVAFGVLARPGALVREALAADTPVVSSRPAANANRNTRWAPAREKSEEKAQ